MKKIIRKINNNSAKNLIKNGFKVGLIYDDVFVGYSYNNRNKTIENMLLN